MKGRRPNPGFVRRHPTNPFRLVFDDGSSYFPIGLQDCWGDNSGTGSVLDQCSMEGPFRTDLKNPPPPGVMFVRGPSSNPQNADDHWYEITIPYLKSIDPYHHPVTTSWECPELSGIEINTPHWYQQENELQSDAITASRAKNWKKHNKPVVIGEQGNHVDRRNRPLGVVGVWDNRSALRMRIRNWTAFFNEIAFIFWKTSYARDGRFMNIWLGPEEREYVRAMQDFAYRLDKDVRMIAVTVSNPHAVRAYGLASKERAGVYLYHFGNHTKPVKGVKVTIDVPKTAKGYWYSPENAAILEAVDVSAGKCSFEVPEFTVDIALLITPDEPPDIDKDGKPNDLDADDDEDGIPDKKDAFPLDPEEWADKDADLIGDNLDADDDGNSIGDADLDRDSDGWSDKQEKRAGTNPLDKVSFPK